MELTTNGKALILPVMCLSVLEQGKGYEMAKGALEMRAWLINKNLCVYYYLRKGIGKKRALTIAKSLEWLIKKGGEEE